MREKKNKTWLIIGILFVIVIVLLIIIAYAFAIKPAITGNIIKAQGEGYAYAIGQIIQQASSCQVVPLTFGNQTINIISVECLQQAQEQ